MIPPPPTLFDRLAASGSDGNEPPRNDSVQRSFEKFHEAHTDVYDELRRIALRMHATGVRRGTKHLFERLRYEFDLKGVTHGMGKDGASSTRGCLGFKLCNSYTSRYARLLERENPQLRGYFHKRRLTARGVKP